MIPIPLRPSAPAWVFTLWPRGERNSRLARGASWSIIGSCVSRAFALAVSVLCARLLVRTDFGQLAMVQSTFVVFGSFAEIGLRTTAAKHLGEFRRTNPVRAGNIVALSLFAALVSGTVLTVLFALAAPVIGQRLLATPHMGSLLILGSLNLLLSSVNGAQLGILSGLEAFKTIARLNLWMGLCSVPFAYLGTAFWGLSGSVVAGVASFGFAVLLAQILLSRALATHGIGLRFPGCWSEASVLWKFSLPAFLSSSSMWLATWICNALLTRQPSGYSELALFNIAALWRSAMVLLPATLGNAWLPMMSEIYGRRKYEEFKGLVGTNLAITAGFACIIAVGVALLSPLIMSLYGKSFSDEWPVLIVSAGTVVISASANVIGLAIASTGRMWWGFALNLLWAIVLVTLAFPLVRRGAMGMAFAYLGAYIVLAIAVALYTHRTIRTSFGTNDI